MTHNQLHKLLLDLENQVATPSASAFPPGGLVRTKMAPVQVFALHQPGAWKSLSNQNKTPEDHSPPIVVAVGGNYTQAKESVPRDWQDPPPEVLDDLSNCKQHFAEGLNEYLKIANPRKWFDLCAASSASIALGTDYHFVMTNFCLWITNDSWQNMTPQARARLLVSNPPFGAIHAPAGIWPHLDALANALKGQKALWVAHGKDCEVFALFRQWIARYPNQDWLLLPNLAFHYRWDVWPYPNLPK